MTIFKTITVALSAVAVGIVGTHRYESKRSKALVERTKYDTRETTWSQAFTAGWDSAKDHYTLYYDRPTWKRVFGTDRGW